MDDFPFKDAKAGSQEAGDSENQGFAVQDAETLGTRGMLENAFTILT